MSKKIVEVKTDFTDEQNYTFVDAYFDSNADSEGKSICAVCNDTSKVLFLDKYYCNDSKVLEAIEEIKETLRKGVVLEVGQEVTINMPFTLTIGDEGWYTDKTLMTIADCEDEVRAEIDDGDLNSSNIMLNVEKI